jgi:hypothetical protein
VYQLYGKLPENFKVFTYMCQQGTPNLTSATRRGWWKAEGNIVSNSMFEINFRPCNKSTTVCAYLLPYHPSVHLQETYNLSSYQRTIRKRPSSWKLKVECGPQVWKGCRPMGYYCKIWLDIHPFSGSILEQMRTRNTSPTRYITLDQRARLVFLYSRTLPDDGTLVPKH